MPLVRIDLSADASEALVSTVSRAVYDAMTAVANVPEDDKFQIVTRHAPDELVYPDNGYLGVSYTRSLVFIQVTWVRGRSLEVKKAFYRAVADNICGKTDFRREDIVISLVESAREDWSFGNGEMQYAPKDA